ncbi:unnamed protein product [Rotaria sp. Silwood1]|nr:unnamed protein product [Rotaria sp. Silwood1]
MPTTTVPPNIADHVSIVRVSKAENPIEIRKVPTEQATDDVDDIKTVVQPSKVKVQRVKKVSSKTQENNFEAISLQELGLSSISAFTNAEVTVTKLPRHSTVEAQLNQIIDNKVHDSEKNQQNVRFSSNVKSSTINVQKLKRSSVKIEPSANHSKLVKFSANNNIKIFTKVTVINIPKKRSQSS